MPFMFQLSVNDLLIIFVSVIFFELELDRRV